MKSPIPIISLCSSLILAAPSLVGAEQDIAAQNQKAKENLQKLVQDLQQDSQDNYQKAIQVYDQSMRDFDSMIRPESAGTGRSLVIRSVDVDPAQQSNLQEDLTVMSRVLDKAVMQRVGEDRPRARTAMGITLVFQPNSSPIRSLYLDDYGALFMLNVGFPLLPPPAKPETKVEKTPTDSNWEDARRELYGDSGSSETSATPNPAESYSEEKVNQLKDAILTALKDAANIRNLKADDSITVCVFGGNGAVMVRNRPIAKTTGTTGNNLGTKSESFFVSRGGGGGARSGGAALRGTTITIRVKKSDVDAFSKDKLSLDEFRKRARITTYVDASGPSRPVGVVSFGGGGGGFGGFGGGGSGGFGGFGTRGGGGGGFGGSGGGTVPPQPQD